jgi:hypothetical protein
MKIVHKDWKQRVILRAALMLLSFCTVAPRARAQNFRAAKVTSPPPQDLSAAVRDVLTREALRVTGPSGVQCDVWLRQAVPVAAGAKQDQGIAFWQIAEGTLIGAIRFPDNVLDYRGQPIPAGVYTLRYALIPEDGSHQGVAPPQRDFLLLGPAADDTSPNTITRDETLDMSRKVTHTRHPTIWSLAPSKANAATLPGMTHQDDPDCWYLNFSLIFEGSRVTPAALVVYGHVQS